MIESQKTGPQPSDYQGLLARYLQSHDEESLYQVSLTSQTCIESGMGPEDIIALHFEALDRVLAGATLRERARANFEAQEVLLEVMIAYGVKYKEYLELKLVESLRDAEAGIARERERAHEAERLQVEKDQLLAVIAHELRTPITVAKGNVDLASIWISQGDVGRVSPLLTQTREALERLSRLTGDLVEASRGELPGFELARQDLDPIVMQACSWVRPTALGKGILLNVESGGVKRPILGNGDSLLGVLGNLLSNAVRYTPSGGTVWVRQREQGEWAVVEIQDTGIGMSPETQSRIFDKFYRAPEARQIEVHGLGLGLALVQQVVLAHQGRVEVESEPGKGSTFRILLPLAAD